MVDTVPPWLVSARAKIDRLHDGNDVVVLAQDLVRAIPGQAAYWRQARADTPWCGVFIAHELTLSGVLLPGPDSNGVGAMYVDWWLNFGSKIEVGQEQPGDIALWLGPDLHHVSFVAGNGKYIGGNQSDGVTETRFRQPDAIRRPPAPSIQPIQLPAIGARPELARGDSGPFVIELQKLLGITVTGVFDSATDAAVGAFQSSHGLDVDGIVGEQTWPALLAAAGKRGMPQDAIDRIVALAGSSELASYRWADRGVAPRGYIKGMAVTYAKVYAKFKAGDSAALVMAQPIGDDEHDALKWYEAAFHAAGLGGATTAVDRLRNNFTLLIGLGMRESSGRYSEGRDQSASNTSADSAEAGLFQQSWDSHGASAEISKLFAAYLSKPDDGFLSIFREGVSISDALPSGEGTGADFQRLAIARPAFAVEAAAVGVRVLRQHWGPINRHEAEIRPEADRLLQQVQVIVDAIAVPIEGEVIPPLSRDDMMLFLLIFILSEEKTMDANTRAFLLETLSNPNADIKAALLKVLGGGTTTFPPPKPDPIVQPVGEFDIGKFMPLLSDPTVKKILTAVPITELLGLIPRVLAMMRGQTAPPMIPGTVVETPPVVLPPSTPTPITEKPSVQLSGIALALSTLLQAFGVVGTPFGITAGGSEPSQTGTLATLIPMLTGLVGATGGWGAMLSMGIKLFGGLLAKPK